MKKIVLAIATIALTLLSTNTFAQGKYGADSAECVKYLSYYKEYFKQKNYDESLPNWRKAYNLCPPTANQNLIIDGTTLLRRLISQNAKNPEYQAALIDSLFTLHDIRAEYYPKYATTALNNKAVDISNFVKNDSETAYNLYKEIIDVNGAATKSTVFIFAFNSAVDLFQQAKMDAEEVINCYQKYMELLGQATSSSDDDAEQLSKVKTDLESLFITSKVASCDNLIALFTPRFEANPDDIDLVTNIVKMMSTTEDCSSNDLYLNAVTAMHKLDPSYNSAYYLYRLNSARGNIDEAIAYLEQAIAYPESDAAQDGEYYYELAAFCFKNGKSSKAYDSAMKAVDFNPEMAGKAYFLIGTIWGATSCGGDEVARRSPYWVAVDYLTKAKNADESLTEEANRMISQYRAYFPQTADAFMYDVTDGQSYTVSCGGMRATTTVRTQK